MNKGFRLFVLAVAVFYPVWLCAQTGPAGVGTSATNVLWLKANAGTSTTTNGAPVATWNDQSGNGMVFSQSSANQQPLFEAGLINGFPAINFDNNASSGQNDFLISPDNALLDNTGGYSFFTVTRMKGFGSAQAIISKRNGVGDEQAFMLFYYSGNQLYVDIDNHNNRFSSGSSTPVNTSKIYDVIYDGSLSTPQRSKIYDQENLLVTSVESSSIVPDKSSPTLIGSTHSGDTRAFNGYISEIIVYRTAVSDAQRSIINNYLSAKYDIALTANDLYTGDNAANGNYDFDVSGIGRDASGNLNGSFATSVCAGLGMTSISGTGNGDYILAGHALSTNSEVFSDIAGISGTNTSRWERIWYFDITNAGIQQTVDLVFDMSDAGMSSVVPGLAANYVLIYRPSQSGSWTEIATAGSVSGDRVTFSGITLSNDGYYTLATRDFVASPLPITLVSFTAGCDIKARTAEILWETAAEPSLTSFDVQRSENGQQWGLVQSVEAKGMTQSGSHYSISDYQPLNGISYYRLQQNYSSGAHDYSEIRSLQCEETSVSTIVFPNPATTALNIHTLHPFESIALYDPSGRMVADFSAFSSIGEHYYQLDVSGYGKGVYFLRAGKEFHTVAITH